MFFLDSVIDVHQQNEVVRRSGYDQRRLERL